MQTKLLLLGLFLSLQLSAQKKPNVIVIMTDDMGNNIEALGNPWLKTPNLNKLHDESAVLTNFHQAIMCTPSRAGLMTGKYAVRTGAWRTSVGRSNMRPEEVTMAEVFKANGYRTGQFENGTWGDVWPFTATTKVLMKPLISNAGASAKSPIIGGTIILTTPITTWQTQKYKAIVPMCFLTKPSDT